MLAVGQRVFVNSTDKPSRPVALGDESGKLLTGVRLIDGAEVEVLAWRPRGAVDTRYRVRALDGADGWLPAGNLRMALVPPAPPPAPAAAGQAVPAEGDARPFGRRSHVGLPSAPRTSPASSVQGGGRRFGEHF